jgi:hypothetical protein
VGTTPSGCRTATSWPASSILLIAFVKIRFVGLYFMELRGAPTLLGSMFESYCVIVCAALTVMYLLA